MNSRKALPVRISLFGSLADAIGREVELPVPSGATVADLRRGLADAYPAAAPLLTRPQVRACLNNQIVGDEQPVPEGAELAFFPPLSGG